MIEEKFKETVAELGKCTVPQIRELQKQIYQVLEEVGEDTHILSERWHLAEEIDNKGIYKKIKYRQVQRIGFYIRPLREWFYPCEHCQRELKKQMAEGNWILGNKDYYPEVELNTTNMDIDEDSFVTLEERKATLVELKRIGLEGFEEIK
jgi:hypothetical protein